MRYNERITLYQTLSSGYNPSTGQTGVQVDGGVTLPCHSSPVSVEQVSRMFGSVSKNVTTARLLRPLHKKVDKAEKDGIKYVILRHVQHKSESVFYLEEVDAWN